MKGTSDRVRPVFQLQEMTESILIDMCAAIDVDVLPTVVAGHQSLFYLLGQPEDIQRLLSEVKASTGRVRVYSCLELALADEGRPH